MTIFGLWMSAGCVGCTTKVFMRISGEGVWSRSLRVVEGGLLVVPFVRWIAARKRIWSVYGV